MGYGFGFWGLLLYAGLVLVFGILITSTTTT